MGKWNEWTREIRKPPDKIPMKQTILLAGGALVSGLSIGVIAKAADSTGVVGNIGDHLGIWVFIAACFAAFSPDKRIAAMTPPLFLLAALATYYLYCNLVLGFFPESYFLGWLAVACLSPIYGIIVWFGHGKGLLAAVAAALPIGLLVAEGYPAYYAHQVPLILDLLFAVALLLILPKGWKQKGCVLLASMAVAVGIVNLRMFALFPW